MDLVYLDYNCFQRDFDDLKQVRIRMEALACREIFMKAEKGEIRLVWSFMHQDETILCPFPKRKYEVLRLSELCIVRIGPKDDIYKLAKSYQEKAKFSSKDAIHIACASFINADFFLTCDDRLMNQTRKLEFNTKVMNPIDYIRLDGVYNGKDKRNG
jgi:predicted nucleic acid-binding protein